MMDIAADELLAELERIDTTLQQVVRRAGQGEGPEVDRQLCAHMRSLRSLLCADGVVAAMDLVEAARRVMDSAEPAAPLRMLAMARQTLAAVVRRQAASARMRVAA